MVQAKRYPQARHVLAAEPRRQYDALVAALARIDLTLDRRRGGRQHDRDFCDASALNRHVAGVIMRAVLLLVGLVVFLIDHDQAEIRVRHEQRGARADHDMRVAGGDRGPVARAVARRQPGMPLQRTHAEADGEAVEELPGQRDLRHQDQRLFAAPDDFGNRLEIHLGLARAGDAVEQGYVKAAVCGQASHRIDSGALLPRKIRHRKRWIGRGRRRRGRQRLGLQRAFIDEAVDHAGADAGLFGRVRLAVQQAVGQQLDHAAPRRRHALRRRSVEAHTGARPLRAEMLAHP
jgi:hypothetical protein